MNRWVWVVFSIVLFQASDVTLKILSLNANFVVASIMQAIPLATVCGVVIYNNPRLSKISINKSSLKLIVLYGSLQFLIGNMFYFAAMRHGGLSIASPTVQSQAIWAVILGMFLLKEKISQVMWFGISMFAVGIIGLAFFRSLGTQMQNGWILGASAGLFAGLCWASATVIQKKLLINGVELVYILFFGTLLGILLLVVFGFATMGESFGPEFGKLYAYKMLIVGIFYSGAIWCISEALKQIPISKVIPVLSINIIFNTITGYIFFGEFINVGTFMSMLIAVLGIVLVNEPIKALKLGLSTTKI